MDFSRSFGFTARWMALVFSIAFIVLIWIFNLEIWIATPAWILTLLPLMIARIVGATTDENSVSGRKFIYIFVIICLIILGVVCWQLGVLGGQGSGQGGGIGEGENEESEKVLFRYEASFQYLGSEENLTLEGYLILFPCPTVDGKPVFRDKSLNYKYERSEVENFYWQLWGLVEGENATWLEKEVNDGKVINWVGGRADSPPDNDFYESMGEPFHTPDNSFVEQYGRYGFNWKILLQNGLDRIYSGEMLKSIGYFKLLAEDADYVNIREDDVKVRSEYGDVICLESIGVMGLEEPIPIDISFHVKLVRKLDNKWKVVGNYEYKGENVLCWNSGWLDLSPV